MSSISHTKAPVSDCFYQTTRTAGKKREREGMNYLLLIRTPVSKSPSLLSLYYRPGDADGESKEREREGEEESEEKEDKAREESEGSSNLDVRLVSSVRKFSGLSSVGAGGGRRKKEGEEKLDSLSSSLSLSYNRNSTSASVGVKSCCRGLSNVSLVSLGMHKSVLKRCPHSLSLSQRPLCMYTVTVCPCVLKYCSPVSPGYRGFVQAS